MKQVFAILAVLLGGACGNPTSPSKALPNHDAGSHEMDTDANVSPSDSGVDQPDAAMSQHGSYPPIYISLNMHGHNFSPNDVSDAEFFSMPYWHASVIARAVQEKHDDAMMALGLRTMRSK